VDIPLKAAPRGTLTLAQRQAVTAAIEANRTLDGALLPVLHAVQRRLGHIPPEALPAIAHELNLSRAEVHGVLTFYHWFRTTPPGRTVLHLCRAEACQALGAARLEAHARQSLGVDFHGTTPDGAVTLEPVYCLGNCSLGPSMLVGERLHGRVTPERFDTLVAEARK
jgi:formate dehydrogenase subunit gamma